MGNRTEKTNEQEKTELSEGVEAGQERRMSRREWIIICGVGGLTFGAGGLEVYKNWHKIKHRVIGYSKKDTPWDILEDFQEPNVRNPFVYQRINFEELLQNNSMDGQIKFVEFDIPSSKLVQEVLVGHYQDYSISWGKSETDIGPDIFFPRDTLTLIVKQEDILLCSRSYSYNDNRGYFISMAEALKRSDSLTLRGIFYRDNICPSNHFYITTQEIGIEFNGEKRFYLLSDNPKWDLKRLDPFIWESHED